MLPKTSLIAGVAIVARDENGMWIAGATQKRITTSAMAAEMYGIRLGLQIAREKGWDHIIVTSDCQQEFD